MLFYVFDWVKMSIPNIWSLLLRLSLSVTLITTFIMWRAYFLKISHKVAITNTSMQRKLRLKRSFTLKSSHLKIHICIYKNSSYIIQTFWVFMYTKHPPCLVLSKFKLSKRHLQHIFASTSQFLWKKSNANIYLC